MPAARLEILLLGPVAAVGDGEPLALGGARQRRLLALLALECGRVISFDRLSDELWSGSPPPGSPTTLRSYVSRLRASLGSAAIGARGGGYVLEAGSVEVDVARAEALAAEGRTAFERGAAGLAATRLASALELWRGRTLDDVRDDGSLAVAGARLDELRLTLLEQRLEADLQLGRHAEVVAELQSLVTAEPLRERLWHDLVLALYRAGRQADALEAYRRAASTLREELGLDPGAELRDLERAVLRHEVPAASAPEQRHNLPAPVTTFVGRTGEIAEVTDLLHARRLVTLTGVGGVGKTRIAIELARSQVGSWRDGVWLVDLTATSDAGRVWSMVASALDLDHPRLPAREALPRALRDAELLLVLDNCEHLVEGCAELSTTLLLTCPLIRMLATSRVTLGAEGEATYVVESLPVPDPGGLPDEVERSDAVRLFVQRADEIRRGAVETSEHVAAAGRICIALDGLPLAIELAAARLRALAVDQLESGLVDRFRLLRSWGGIADPRQHTLEAAMDWSYELLTPDEQWLFRRLGVYAGGSTLGSLAGTWFDGDGASTTGRVRGVVDASLVRLEERRGVLRYRLLETVRAYALQRLDEAGEQAEAREAHATFFLELAESLYLSVEAYETHGVADHETAVAEQENFVAALDWLAAHDRERALRLAVALEQHWVALDPFEGARLFESLLAEPDDLPDRLLARAYRCLGGSRVVSGDGAGGVREYERSLPLYERLADEWGIVHMRNRLALELLDREDWALARQMFDENQARADALGSDLLLGEVALGLSWVARADGDLERAFEHDLESLERFRACGFVWLECSSLVDLAELSMTLGRYEEGKEYVREALAVARRMNDRRHAAYALAELARGNLAQGEPEGAGRLWGAIEAEEERFSLGEGPLVREQYAAFLEGPDGASLRRGLDAGRALAFDELTDLVLASGGPSASAVAEGP